MDVKTVSIENLMNESGVKFGTSGARGLVTDMTDEVCYAYTTAFLQSLQKQGEIQKGETVAVGGDLRPSTGRIMRAVSAAAADLGYKVENCARLPSPALAYYGLLQGIATVMVTGSHIPEDRNGIKYTKKQGEILKNDEALMKAQTVLISKHRFNERGDLIGGHEMPAENLGAMRTYLDRYLDGFPAGCLKGLKVGVYLHSAVGRDAMVSVLSGLGADVVQLGYSDVFVPVDTEAIRPEDVEAAKKWSFEHKLDAIVSTDGDSDRPLVADERGRWIRGDVAGILVSKFLGADTVVVPVSCNTAVEKCGWFERVVRTRIGSPFVIEDMQNAERVHGGRVVGYEANGGFLVQSRLEIEGRTLLALPTRDALIVHLAILMLARQQRKRISELLLQLPERFTYSDRLKNFPVELSRKRIEALYSKEKPSDFGEIIKMFGEPDTTVISMDTTDGLRITFSNLEVIHLRPSGNAPELRCYTEADSEQRAQELNRRCIEILQTWR